MSALLLSVSASFEFDSIVYRNFSSLWGFIYLFTEIYGSLHLENYLILSMLIFGIM